MISCLFLNFFAHNSQFQILNLYCFTFKWSIFHQINEYDLYFEGWGTQQYQLIFWGSDDKSRSIDMFGDSTISISTYIFRVNIRLYIQEKFIFSAFRVNFKRYIQGQLICSGTQQYPSSTSGSSCKACPRVTSHEQVY